MPGSLAISSKRNVNLSLLPSVITGIVPRLPLKNSTVLILSVSNILPGTLRLFSSSGVLSERSDDINV